MEEKKRILLFNTSYFPSQLMIEHWREWVLTKGFLNKDGELICCVEKGEGEED